MTRILFACYILVFASCRHLTVAPRPVEAHQVAIGSTNKPDADVIDCDAKGCLVRQAWLDTYTDLEIKFKETIPADKLIVPEAGHFRIPYKVSDHMADLKRKQRLAEAGA